MTLFEIVLNSIFSPITTFRKMSLLDDSNKFGWIFIVSFAFLYTLTVIMFHLNEFIPVLNFFLPVSKEKYYFYQSFLTFPVSILGVIINYSMIIGLLKLNSINIGDRNLWGPVSIASILPSYLILWFFETFIIVLYFSDKPWTYFIIDIIRIVFGIIWTIFLTICSVKIIEDISWKKAIIIGSISSISMMTFFGIFFR